jgi:hypothetical protein
MNLATLDFVEKSRLRALLDHFSVIEDPREPWRVRDLKAQGMRPYRHRQGAQDRPGVGLTGVGTAAAPL